MEIESVFSVSNTGFSIRNGKKSNMVGRPKGSGRIHSDSNFRLPTGNNVVSRDSLWKFIKTISQADRYFTKEDLSTLGLYTRRADKIRCNLAYLKYLGVIEETRERVEKEGKDGRQQKFKLTDLSTVQEMVSKIRANEESAAKVQWMRLLADHPIWQHLQLQFFKGNPVKTTLELQHFIKNEIPRKTAVFYHNSSKFLVELLTDATLIQKEGNQLFLNTAGTSSTPMNGDLAKSHGAYPSGFSDAHELPAPALPPDSWMPEPPEFGEQFSEGGMSAARFVPGEGGQASATTAQRESDVKAGAPQQKDYYTIRISGPHINTSIELKSREQLRIIDVILESVRASVS